jgi:Tol biopolymer transport system component
MEGFHRDNEIPGRSLALDSKTEGKSQIWVIPADGGAPRHLTGGEGNNDLASWSRDGQWIYFESNRSGQNGIWKAPARGGSAVQVARALSGAVFESSDGKYLYSTSRVGIPALFRVPVAGGEERQVVPRVWGAGATSA